MAKLVVITGPSGVGKGSLIARLIEDVHGLVLSVSATTRAPREGEVDGREYHFLDEASFDQRLARGDFLESASFAGNRYGTLLSEVENRPDSVRGVVLEIETKGADSVRKRIPEAIRIFVAPPDEESLRSRLTGRGTDDAESIERRLEEAKRELTKMSEFDTVIVNDDLGRAATELAAEVEARLD